MCRGEGYGQSMYLPLNFTSNLELLLKYKVLKKNQLYFYVLGKDNWKYKEMYRDLGEESQNVQQGIYNQTLTYQ